MKTRKQKKASDPVAKALRTMSIFAPKVVPNKKGKGVVYNRAKEKGRNISDPFFYGCIHVKCWWPVLRPNLTHLCDIFLLTAQEKSLGFRGT